MIRPVRLAALAALLAFSSFAAEASALDPAFGRADAALAKGDYAGAQREYASVKGGAEGADARVREARLLLVTGKYTEAIDAARAAAGLGRAARNEAAAVRAEALAATGKTSEAIAACKEVASDDTARRARLVLGGLYAAAGKRAEARGQLTQLTDDYSNDRIAADDALGLAMAARAAFLVGTNEPRNTNSVYKEALHAGAGKLVEPLLWHAELYLETEDLADAGASVKDALKVAPKDPRAHVMMARLKLENGLDFEAAESEITQALEVNPNLPAAFFLRAGMALRDLDITAADAAADRGLAVNPVDLELLSMKAAIRFLADDRPGYQAFKKRVLALNPRYSKFFRVVGEFAEWEHRYDDIVAMMREATQVDPADAKAFAALGMNLVRTGDDKGAKAALDQAWAIDNHDVRVANTRKILFERVAADYTTVDGKPFTIRYSKEDKPILERYVPRMLEEAWASMVKRYGFTPKTPVRIELYAEEELFSVRTSGLPHVGIQGVCFGQTLAALSPSAAPFNWGNVLWHELGHVFAIQMSKNHVPRWFTEGLSEYETIIRRPEWQREQDPELFAALKNSRVPEVASFNRAFTHAKDVSDVTMAYYAASQIQLFLAEEFGFPKMVSMLPKWGNGERTAEVVKESLGVTSEELDRRFRAWLAKRLVRYTKQYVPDMHAPPLDDARKAVQREPKVAKRYVELALALIEEHQREEADAVLGEALRIDPKQPDAEFVRVRLALTKKDYPEATKQIGKMVADGNDGYAVRLVAAGLAERAKDPAKEKANLEAAHALDPSQEEPLRDLLKIARKAHDDAAELAILRKLALIDQHDRKIWGALLQALIERGQWEEAKKVGESAMFVDVQNPKVHRLYARALARTGNFVTAIFELNSALVCRPKPTEQAEIYGELAKAYDKLGKPDLAEKARGYAAEVGKGAAQRELDDAAHGRGKVKGHGPAESDDSD